MSDQEFTSLPAAQSCRQLGFESAEITKEEKTGCYYLTVKGTKPCINMTVSLMPLVYIRCPEYWGIEVVGCLPGGICLPTTGSYEVTIPLAGIIGSEGIEVIGANQQKRFKVPGGCS